MTQWLVIGAIIVWLGSFIWVVQDAYASFPRSTVVWWGLLALVLGPFAVALYLSERMTQRARMNRAAPGKATDFPVAEGRRPFRPAGLRLFEPGALPPGSGLFLTVQRGPDPAQQIEIPRDGGLIVRRAVGAERSRPGLLVLHDPAASRQRHCRFWVDRGRLMFEDSSTHGTEVNGTRIKNKSVELQTGSTIRIGKTMLTVRDA
jgi:hypothetical protein